MAKRTNKRGKTALVESSKTLAAFLQAGDYGHMTWYMKQRMIKAGYLQFAAVKTGGKGRPTQVATLTGKGRGFLAIASKWKSSQPAMTA